MSFEYCCFISFPHGQRKRLVPIVKNFVEGLETEIALLTEKEIWIDSNFLEGGKRLDKTIGPSICKSACMIILFTPFYFDKEHVYCAREFKAMQDLEEQRLKLLENQGNGLIIPIILGGESYFPESLRKKSIYYDFTDIEHNNPWNKIRVKYKTEIKAIAKYIFERVKSLEKVMDKFSHDCDKYCLPTDDEAIEFIETILGEPIKDVAASAFVGRTENASEGGR